MKRFNPIDARIQAKDSTQLSKPVYMNSGNFSKGRHHQDSLDTGSYVSTHPSCGAPPFRKLQNFELRSRVCVWGGEPFFYLMQWEPNLRV